MRGSGAGKGGGRRLNPRGDEQSHVGISQGDDGYVGQCGLLAC